MKKKGKKRKRGKGRGRVYIARAARIFAKPFPCLD
jgi:hypothetical protein